MGCSLETAGFERVRREMMQPSEYSAGKGCLGADKGTPGADIKC